MGLSLDIVGAVMIFCCASQKTIEHALSYGLMKGIEDKYESGEYVEWTGGPAGTGTYTDFQKRVARAGRRMIFLLSMASAEILSTHANETCKPSMILLTRYAGGN